MRRVKIDKNPAVSPGPNSKQFPYYFPGNDWTVPETDVRNVLQPVPEEDANMEAEADEIIFAPDVQGLPATFKVGGDRHSEGGTPLDVPDNSFVFSDTRDMKIGGPILKHFGKSEDTTKKFTPADLAKKYNINKYRKTLADPDSDDYQRDTAEMMIANYNKKLGMLALVQESKKGFPTGIPQVAMPYLITAAVEPDQVLPLKSPGQSQSFPTGQVMKHGGDAFQNSPTGGGFWQAGGNFFDEVKRRQAAREAAIRSNMVLPTFNTAPAPQSTITPAGVVPYLDPFTQAPPVEVGDTTPIYQTTFPPTASDYIQPSSSRVAPPAAGSGAYSPAKATRSSDITAWPGDRNDKSNKSEYTSQQWREFRDTFCPECKTNAELQTKILTNPAFKEDIKRLHDKYGMPKNSPTTMVDSKLGHRWDFVFNPKPGAPPAVAKAADKAGDIISGKGKYRGADPNAPWWLQDTVKTLGSAADLLRLKKYLPWAPKISPYVPEATFYDPTRALANNTEQMAIGTQGAATFAGPQQYSARFSGIQGAGAKNAANILGDYDNRNVTVSNTANAQRADAYNKANEFNAKTTLDLYDKTTIANQQFDNAKNQARQELRQGYIDAITNRAQAQVVNSLYPDYYFDPSTGGTGTYFDERTRDNFFPDQRFLNMSGSSGEEGVSAHNKMTEEEKRAWDVYNNIQGPRGDLMDARTERLRNMMRTYPQRRRSQYDPYQE